MEEVRHRHHHDEPEHHSMMQEEETKSTVSSDDGVGSMEVEMKPLTGTTTNGKNGHGVLDKGEAGLLSAADLKQQPNGHIHTINKTWQERLQDWLFPPDVPRSCQLMRPENIAVPLCYLLVGLLQGLSSPLINVFPLDLGATEAQQTTISSIRSLPASFKLIFGFVSDNIPLFGLRRKPYMFLGWLAASLSVFSLIAFTNLDIDFGASGCFKSSSSSSGENATETAADTTAAAADELITTPSPTPLPPQLPPDAPSITFLSLALLGFGCGFWVADVMGDSVVAEKAKLEPDHSRGSIQSSCYSFRFFGMMMAAPLSTYLYSTAGPYSVILLLSVLPLTILPAVLWLYEPMDTPVRSTSEQCGEIWNTVCSRAVWQPMGFVYLYNVLQVGNSAWREFLKTVLHFSSCDLNILLVVSLVLLYAGIMCYKTFFLQSSWRAVYIWTTLLNGVFSLLQVCLIYGMTFGLSNFLFALGDDAFAEFIVGIQFLPTTIMMVHLCPAGSEGASYAMFTTVNNSALTLSSALSTQLLRIWNVSKEALEKDHLQGMVKLTYLTTFLQVLGVAFVGLLPKCKEDLQDLMKDSHRSTVGGALFLVITFASILYALLVGMLNIAFPGWMGES